MDSVRIPPPLLAQPTLISVHSEMDKKYPNRVMMDVGLAICRYGDALEVGDGVLVAGDGGAHHEVVVRLVVFRPFVEEVCIGTIIKSSEEGIRVSLGFFDDIFIPAYWMLSPSHYEENLGLWVWAPNYGEEEEEEIAAPSAGETAAVKLEGDAVLPEQIEEKKQEENEGDVEENRFEMEIGSEIRFKVKSIEFTEVTNTAKGVQATTTTTSQSQSYPKSLGGKTENSSAQIQLDDEPERPVRKRSTSTDLSESSKMPPSMHIVASICEDGLGLTSWWGGQGEDEEEDRKTQNNNKT